MTPAGEHAAAACAAKAERVSNLDIGGAQKFVLGWLVRHGATSGEDLTDEAMRHGYHAHDARAFGVVYSGLSKRGLIRCIAITERRKGRGTAGARIWVAA